MIGHALDFIVKELNAYFVQSGERDDLVVLERLVNDKGETVAGNGKVCCSLVNMEEERIGKQQTTKGDTSIYGVRKNPDIRVNLYLLFAVNTAPEGYLNGLHLL